MRIFVHHLVHNLPFDVCAAVLLWRLASRTNKKRRERMLVFFFFKIENCVESWLTEKWQVEMELLRRALYTNWKLKGPFRVHVVVVSGLLLVLLQCSVAICFIPVTIHFHDFHHGFNNAICKHFLLPIDVIQIKLCNMYDIAYNLYPTSNVSN